VSTATIGERVRISHAIERLHSLLDGLEIALRQRTPPDPGEAQAVVHAAVDLGMSLAKLDAYTRAETEGTR